MNVFLNYVEKKIILMFEKINNFFSLFCIGCNEVR